MSESADPLTEVAEAILEQAQSITRLDAVRMQADAYDAAYAEHVRAIRLLAVPHMDPQPDRNLVRNLRNLSGDYAGVYVRMIEGTVQLVVDAVSKQHTFKLWNRRQLSKNEEEDEESRGW